MKLGIDIQITLSVYCNIFGYQPIFHLGPSSGHHVDLSST